MIQAIVFFPLAGALIAGLLGRIIGHRASEYVTTGLLIAAALLSWIVFIGYWFAPGDAAAASLMMVPRRCDRRIRLSLSIAPAAASATYSP